MSIRRICLFVGALALAPLHPSPALAQVTPDKTTVGSAIGMQRQARRAAQLSALLTESRYALLKNNPQRLQAAARLAQLGQAVGADEKATDQVMDKVAAGSGAVDVSVLGKELVISGFSLPPGAAKNNLGPGGMLTFLANLQEIGTERPVTDESLWEDVAKHGTANVLADEVAKTYGIDDRHGLSARELLQGLARAARKGAPTNSTYWSRYASETKARSRGRTEAPGSAQPARVPGERPGSLDGAGSARSGVSGVGGGGTATGFSTTAEATQEGRTWIVEVLSRTGAADGGATVMIRITGQDGASETRELVVWPDGTTDVYDDSGNWIDTYPPGSSNLDGVTPGTTYAASDSSHIRVGEADQITGSGSGSGPEIVAAKGPAAGLTLAPAKGQATVPIPVAPTTLATAATAAAAATTRTATPPPQPPPNPPSQRRKSPRRAAKSRKATPTPWGTTRGEVHLYGCSCVALWVSR